MKKYSLKKRIFIYLLPFLLILLTTGIYLIYEKYIASLNIPCFINLFTGYWCPGCGGTRSVYWLIRGNIIKSLHYNPAPFIISVLLFLGYIQLIFKANGKEKRILPKNDLYIIWIVIIMIIYYILRNFIPFLMP